MPSIWSETTQIAPRPPLPGDLETDTAVIGGGMAAGPALAEALLQRFASADPLLAAAGVCALLSLILIAAASAAGKS